MVSLIAKQNKSHKLMYNSLFLNNLMGAKLSKDITDIFNNYYYLELLFMLKKQIVIINTTHLR